MSADPGNDETSTDPAAPKMFDRMADEVEPRLNPHNSYGRLFELGRGDELRHALAVRVKETLSVPNRSVVEILTVVDDIVREREWGWHIALTPERLHALSSCAGDSSRILCADCTLPGCCYFDIVRLTADDITRLSSHLKLPREEFIAHYCSPYVESNDSRYTHALKKAKPCEFLGKNRHCLVYANRPTVCAQFPFSVDHTSGDVVEIRLFPFCNVAFNVVKHETIRRILAGHVNGPSRRRRHRNSPNTRAH